MPLKLYKDYLWWTEIGCKYCLKIYLEVKLLSQRTKNKTAKNEFNIEIVALLAIRALGYQSRLPGEVAIAKYPIVFEKEINKFMKKKTYKR